VNVSETKPSTSLFGAKPAAANGTDKEPMFKPISGGTFGGVKIPEVKPAETQPATTSLFGGVKPAPGGSLFGNLNTVKSDDNQGAAKKPTSLFGGNPTAGTDGNQKFGLFFGKTASAADADAAKPEEKKAGLFGAPPAGGLFGNTAPATGGGLFGSGPPAGGSLFGKPTNAAPGTSLFGGANNGPSLFNFTAPPKKDEDEKDDEEEEEGEKSPPIYADTTKVEFKGAGALTIKPSPYTKLFDVSIN